MRKDFCNKICQQETLAPQQKTLLFDHFIVHIGFPLGSPFAQGQVRNLRVRWALEEAGLPYRARLLELGDQDKPEYRALQPFGQVPIFEEDGRVLFESGAIVLQSGSAAKRSCLRT